MRAVALIAGAALLLGGCAPRAAVRSAGELLCEQQDSARAALALAREKALGEPDAFAREAALAFLRLSEAALDRCPPRAGG